MAKTTRELLNGAIAAVLEELRSELEFWGNGKLDMRIAGFLKHDRMFCVEVDGFPGRQGRFWIAEIQIEAYSHSRNLLGSAVYSNFESVRSQMLDLEREEVTT